MKPKTKKDPESVVREIKRKEEINSPKTETIQTDMAFWNWSIRDWTS